MVIKDIIQILKESLGDRFSFKGKDTQAEVNNLLTDSRNHFEPNGTLFFAIRTPGGNDGHHYITELYHKGVRNFVVEYIPEGLQSLDNINFLIVPDTIKALTDIAKINKSRAKEILAITGSRGKTTLKEMLYQLMEPYKKISRSPRSFNSKIGVPLSLWQIQPNTDLAIIEAGISKYGEMKDKADAIEPDIVIFTNIGEAHSNGFSSLKEKVREKVLLAKKDSVKTIIYPMDYVELDEEIQTIKDGKKLIRWSLKNPAADIIVIPKDTEKDNMKTIIEYKFGERRGNISVKLEKPFDLENVINALAFLLEEGLSSKEIEEGFRNLKKINTRLNVSEGVNGCSVILDSYTSDLSSLLPALDFMNRRKNPEQTKTLIISDIHFEGNSPKETYKEIAKIIKDNSIKKLIGIGQTLKKYKDLFSIREKIFYDSTELFLKEITASDFNDEIILLKGSGEFKFEKIQELLEAKKHETVLEVNLDALLRNYNYFKGKVPASTGIITMVKASGYGAGSYEIAKTLQDAGASYLAVAALDEGIDLRRNGIVMPIMVMNPKAANYFSLFKNRLEPVIYSMSMLRSLKAGAGKYGHGEYPVHLKLDTGMHRMGFTEEELDDVIDLIKTSRDIKVTSIFSHLATADCLDLDDYTYLQLDRFERYSSKIIKALDYPVKRHILNSAGILRFPSYHYDYVRLGIGLYGANTLPEEIEQKLSTVSTLRSVIICLREIEGDEAVGYSRNGKIHGKTKIATVPVGYADGINRKFGNGNLKVMVNGEVVPTIGNICMDAMMLDVTGINCKEGDSVEIFGENMNIQNLADTLGTIPYEILTSVSPRVKRIYYRE